MVTELQNRAAKLRLFLRQLLQVLGLVVCEITVSIIEETCDSFEVVYRLHTKVDHKVQSQTSTHLKCSNDFDYFRFKQSFYFERP